jgi:membrane dipeptidase
MGPGHVGIGLDWDGGGGVDALHDIVGLPKITEALAAQGYDAAQMSRIWSGNLLRLVKQADDQRQR